MQVPDGCAGARLVSALYTLQRQTGRRGRGLPVGFGVIDEKPRQLASEPKALFAWPCIAATDKCMACMHGLCTWPVCAAVRPLCGLVHDCTLGCVHG